MHLKVISLLILAVVLTNCNSNLTKKIVGNTRPDEFAIIKNKPLSIPKNFDLPTPLEKIQEEVMYDQQKNDSTITPGENAIMDKTKNLQSDKNVYKKLGKEKKPNKLQRIF